MAVDVGEEGMAGIRVGVFGANGSGRDFVCADIHGNPGVLLDALGSVGFDRERDRVFQLGDLVDRGPDSVGALALLSEPWFFGLKGNHEETLQAVLEMALWRRHQGVEPSRVVDELGRELLSMGGEWLYDMGKSGWDWDWAETTLAALREMPDCLAVGTGEGRGFFGFHAKSPAGGPTDRGRMEALLGATGSDARGMGRDMRWSFNLPKMGRVLAEGSASVRGFGGGSVVFLGHSVTDKPVEEGGTVWLDTGLGHPGKRGFDPRMSLFEFGTGELRVFRAR